MNREITDIYKKDFFLDFGKQISQSRQRQGLDIDDVSEMTGMSKIKIKRIPLRHGTTSMQGCRVGSI